MALFRQEMALFRQETNCRMDKNEKKIASFQEEMASFQEEMVSFQEETVSEFKCVHNEIKNNYDILIEVNSDINEIQDLIINMFGEIIKLHEKIKELGERTEKEIKECYKKLEDLNEKILLVKGKVESVENELIICSEKNKNWIFKQKNLKKRIEEIDRKEKKSEKEINLEAIKAEVTENYSQLQKQLVNMENELRIIRNILEIV